MLTKFHTNTKKTLALVDPHQCMLNKGTVATTFLETLKLS